MGTLLKYAENTFALQHAVFVFSMLFVNLCSRARGGLWGGDGYGVQNPGQLDTPGLVANDWEGSTSYALAELSDILSEKHP